MWALKNKTTGKYQKNVNWRENAEDLEHAKLYFRKGNAVSAIEYREDMEVVEVRLTEVS